jgi:hypothetical protein
MRPLWRLPLQQFAYRQLMYLVLIQSAMTALTGGRLRWHKLNRVGLGGPRVEASAVELIAAQGVAPAVDTWPSTLRQPRPGTRHPAAGRAVARPPGVGPVTPR